MVRTRITQILCEGAQILLISTILHSICSPTSCWHTYTTYDSKESSKLYYPFFKDALGAIDGTHINCSASAEMCQAACDHKGGVTQNCLAICGFDMIFYYIFSGWDGSAADSTMFYLIMHA